MSHHFLLRYTITTLLLLCASWTGLIGQSEVPSGLDERINDAFMPIATLWEDLIFISIPIGPVDIPIVLILLIGGATYFTLYFKFINIRKLGMAIQVVRGKYDDPADQEQLDSPSSGDDDNSASGSVNHFQALATAISGTVGLGNISMVAVAISIGGPGATFWMIIAGLLGMTSKFVECTLAVRYREIDRGDVYGGPMYYLKNGLSGPITRRFGHVLSIIYAVLCIGASFGGGNAFQSNQATAQLITRFNIEGEMMGTVIGTIIAILVGIVIIGGIKRIARVTEKVVPFMAALYVISALIVLAMNYSIVDDAIALILREAFTPKASITGGISAVIIQGFRRAAFSNEAGAGSAAIAHAAVRTKHAASEGLVALLEPLIDTVVICTITALVIVSYNIQEVFTYGDVVNDQVLINATGARVGGVNLTSMAFDATIPGFSYLLSIAVTLFAFSTIISWSYYGMQSWAFLFGKSKAAAYSYKVIFLIFTVLGAAISLEAVIKFSDAMILALVFPNMIGLICLRRQVLEELNRYLRYIKRGIV